jgi:sodium pump decarboxylase gamma subunit
MVAGMGTVFIFLALMIFIINGLAKVLAPFAGVLEEKKEPRVNRKGSKTEQKDNKAIITAIVSAVHQYRKDRGISN